jgi:hypothetical protein
MSYIGILALVSLGLLSAGLLIRFIIAARGRFCTYDSVMKILLRTAAALSFLFFFAAGLCLLSRTLFSPASDAFAISAVGFFFVGTALFVGPILLVAAEKFGRKDESK